MPQTPFVTAPRKWPHPPRIGLAALTKMAFDGADFSLLWSRLVSAIQEDPTNAQALLDMSFIAQLTGDPARGANLQSHALIQDVLFRSPCASAHPRLRLLAFAAPTDIGGNTPVEFLLEGTDVELVTLYIAPGLPLPDPLPDHDIAIVTIPDSLETRPMLDAIEAFADRWPRPILNRPAAIKGLDRDQLYLTLRELPGVEIPQTALVSRADLADIALSEIILKDVIDDGAYPLILRPRGSHAGNGLERIDAPQDIETYLAARAEDEFFVSRYVDYAGADGLFRKYRIAFIDGRPYACHMAVCGEWKVWYLNAGMADSVEKRAEENRFMTHFDEDFGRRHGVALGEIARRLGLDYVTIDCAETPDGKLLVFEADIAAIVHNMDPADVFPYKAPQMRKLFDAFVAMLSRHAGAEEARAA